MHEYLRKLLVGFGLRADASDVEAWQFYHGLEGDEKSQAEAARRGQESPGDDDADEQDETRTDQTTDGDDAVAAERVRCAAIRRLARDHEIPAERCDEAIEDGSTVDQFRAQALEYLRSNRGQGVPNDPTGVDETPTDVLGRMMPQFAQRSFAIHNRTLAERERAPALAMALMSRCEKIDDPAEALVSVRNGVYSRLRNLNDEQRGSIERSRDWADQYRGMSLAEVAEECLRLDGHTVTGRGRHAVIDALHGLSARGYSSSTLTNVYSTNFSAQFLAGYMGVNDTSGWCSTGDLPDFRTTERSRFKKGSRPVKKTRGKPADHAEFEDFSESYKINRYAQKYTVDEQDIIDDRFGAIDANAPDEMGESCAEIRPDLVYSVILANAAMSDTTALFHTDHGNALTSAAISPSTIATAITTMNTLQENGRTLSAPMKYIVLVPWAKYFSAVQFIDSPTVTSSSGDYNSLKNVPISVVAESRLDNGVVNPDGEASLSGSTTTWYLIAADSRHTVEVGYLRGSNRMPEIRPYTLSQGEWGIGWDVKFDVGAKALDWLGMVRNVQ